MNNKLINFNIKKLINLGVHFGHNKKFRKEFSSNFILGIRKNIDIINVNQTLKQLQNCLPIIINTITNNGQILIFSTNTSLLDTIKTNYPLYQQPTIIGKWIPGTLSNFNQIKQNLNNSLSTHHFGIQNIKRLPSLIILLNKDENHFIINEAKKLHIPIIALTDSNTNIQSIQYPIPSNDDSIQVLSFFFNIFKKSILIGYTKQLLSFK